MKFATLIALVATVKSEEGVSCTSTTDGWKKVEDATLTVDTVKDAASCGTAVTAIAVLADNVALDYCAQATATGVTPKVEASAEGADPVVVAADEVPASFTCEMWSKATADEAQDIRVVKANVEGPPTVKCDAWAWDAGVALDGLVAADGDNAKMITSAIAAIATIAMVAF